jgi:peptidoglycan hydrolase-like protein with peptidoglycan-binding domain
MGRTRSQMVQVFATAALSILGWTTSAVAQVYQPGDQGAAVEDIQSALGLPADGFYGASTEQAVRSFQRNNGLNCVDGLTGPETLEALGLGYLITNPNQPCGNFVGLPPQGRPDTNRPPSSASAVCPNIIAGPYVAIVPGNTGNSPESLRTQVNAVIPESATLRSAPQGSFIQAGRFDSFECAEARAAFLRAAGFDARAVYNP